MRRRETPKLWRNVTGGTADAAGPTYSGLMDEYWVAVIWSLLPTVVVLGLFVFVLRGIFRMDRTERRVYARIEAQERAKRGLPPTPGEASRPASPPA
jgi:hypothetical protein